MLSKNEDFSEETCEVEVCEILVDETEPSLEEIDLSCFSVCRPVGDNWLCRLCLELSVVTAECCFKEDDAERKKII